VIPLPLRLGALLLLASVCEAQVFLRSQEIGQGVLRARGGECFVLAPEHVVSSGAPVTVIAEHRRQGIAQVEATYAGDVALLRVDPSALIPCAGAWDAAAQLRERLTSAVEGTLETRNEDGSLQRRFVRITSHDTRFVTVRPAAAADALFRGLSGSLLRIGGTPAGMLLQVDAETGDGVVLRMDHLSDIVRNFFDVPMPVAAVSAEGYTIEPADLAALVSERTGLREQPDQRAGTITMLDVGAVVRVTGRIKERLWFRVVTGDGRTGFVPTRSVKQM
jgi:hypothetical protein